MHARIEEEIFYPAVRTLQDERLNALLDESFSEHATIKERVAAVRAAIDTDDELRTRVGALEECVQHHVREEEQEMFPLLAERMPPAARAKVGRALAARKRTAAPPSRTRTAKRTAARRTAQGGRKTTARARKRTTTTGKKKASGDRRR